MATIGVTRGLGDHDLKVYNSNIYIKPFLSCVPEVRQFQTSFFFLNKYKSDTAHLSACRERSLQCTFHPPREKYPLNVVKATIAESRLARLATAIFTVATSVFFSASGSSGLVFTNPMLLSSPALVTSKKKKGS